jgi:hypothetical protein
VTACQECASKSGRAPISAFKKTLFTTGILGLVHAKWTGELDIYSWLLVLGGMIAFWRYIDRILEALVDRFLAHLKRPAPVPQREPPPDLIGATDDRKVHLARPPTTGPDMRFEFEKLDVAPPS